MPCCRDGDAISITATVPANTGAQVRLPDGRRFEVGPGAVLLPWLDEVAAVLQVWYPGERYGTALAAMLFGDAEPGGRLPLTFPHRRADLPGGDRGPDAVATVLDYDADGGIGYRSPEVIGSGCTFPFGHGLGYARTSERVSGAEVTDGRLRVRFVATNHSDRATTSVLQGYVRVGEAAPELAAVVRTPLEPRQSVETEVLGAEAWARWSEQEGATVPVDGSHTLLLGPHAFELHESLAIRIAHRVVTHIE